MPHAALRQERGQRRKSGLFIVTPQRRPNPALVPPLLVAITGYVQIVFRKT